MLAEKRFFFFFMVLFLFCFIWLMGGWGWRPGFTSVLFKVVGWRKRISKVVAVIKRANEGLPRCSNEVVIVDGFSPWFGAWFAVLGKACFCVVEVVYCYDMIDSLSRAKSWDGPNETTTYRTPLTLTLLRPGPALLGSNAAAHAAKAFAIL